MELLVTMVITLLIFIIISTSFILTQRVFREGNTRAELIQNGRITTDLMAREIRQAVEIVTTLPPDNSNPAIIPHDLQFEDGHVTSQIQYLKYYLEGNLLRRQIIVYDFETNPGVYVYWNDTDPFGEPRQNILEDKIIGEYFSNIDFYGLDVINLDITLEKNDERIKIKSIIFPRNI